MTDQQIIEALIARDDAVTRQFFFKSCRPMCLSVINHVFSYKVDYDEFVNEFYIYLMENDARRLRMFEGRSSIYQWLKVTAIRYFIAKRDKVIDIEPEKPLLDIDSCDETFDSERDIDAQIDVAYLFGLMANKRYVYVVKRLILDEAEPQIVAQELQVSVDNLYNIKKRAIASMTQIALNEIKEYEKDFKK